MTQKYKVFSPVMATHNEDFSDDDFEDVDEDEEDFFVEGGETRGLFGSRDKVFVSASECLEEAKGAYGFDLLHLRRRLRLDCFGTIRLVNFLRSKEGISMGPEAIMGANTQAAWADEKYLKPVSAQPRILSIIWS